MSGRATDSLASWLDGRPHWLVSLAKTLLVFIALGYALTTAYGIWQNYSEVPVWDMWNGYLKFYYLSQQEGWPLWFSQHNEHRLALGRIFFWLDMHFFHGNLMFLVAMNFVFSTLLFLTLFLVFKRLQASKDSLLLYFGMLLLVFFCFSWLQHENYIWAFQGQFHMAYLLPLWSFLALAKTGEKGDLHWFLLALALGAASMVTMANGVLALPIMVCASLLLGVRRRYTLILLVATLLLLWLYFANYQAVSFHPSMRDGLLNNPKGSFLYFVRYLSGPFGMAADRNPVVGILAGGGFVLVCAYVAFRAWLLRRAAHQNWQLIFGLLAYLLFIGGTALSTSLSRVMVDAAFPSRYMTPALLGWASLTLLVLYFHRTSRKTTLLLCMLLLAPLYMLFDFQERALTQTNLAHVNRTAALAVVMEVEDMEYLRHLYWDKDRLFEIASLAREEQKSIYGAEHIRHMPALGTPWPYTAASDTCRLYIDNRVVIAEHPAYTRLHGWSYAPESNQVPVYLVFTQNEVVQGYAFGGALRPDVADALQTGQASRAGFTGYQLSDVPDGPIQAYGYDKHGRLLCSFVSQ